MSKLHLYKHEDGNIYKATAGEPITHEYLQGEYTKAALELYQWSEALKEYDRLTASEDKPSPTVTVSEQAYDIGTSVKLNPDGTTATPTKIPVI